MAIRLACASRVWENKSRRRSARRPETVREGEGFGLDRVFRTGLFLRIPSKTDPLLPPEPFNPRVKPANQLQLSSACSTVGDYTGSGKRPLRRAEYAHYPILPVVKNKSEMLLEG